MRRGRAVEFSAVAAVPGRGRTRFRTELRPENPRAVRFVRVAGYSLDSGRSRSASVRVR